MERKQQGNKIWTHLYLLACRCTVLTNPESEGRPVQSHLEQIVRRTHAIYATLHEQGIDAIPSWTGDAKGATVSYRRNVSG